ncbi:hypothetical protein KQX54_017078 [Cotesia glomerata]|uniref:Uncharacterized protein n=1 Tax=Cotesia glomerata TaxID=32391 RepID=A0AAV7I1X5_COTGL|nr:hypothetical protein KQX54_017078 [Cotesia glomerata]
MIRVDPDAEELGRGKQKSEKKNAGIELTDMVVGCCNGRGGAKACEGSEGSVATMMSLCQREDSDELRFNEMLYASGRDENPIKVNASGTN